MAVPEKKFFRLAPGRDVRLKHAYYVTCTGYETDENGNVTVVHCDYDPASRGGWSEDGRKVKATLHWVSAQHALEAEVRLYGRLFTVENPDSAEGSFLDYLNKDSLEIIEKAYVEPSLADAKQGVSYQFLRLGYFCLDDDAVKENRLVFNRSVALKDSK